MISTADSGAGYQETSTGDSVANRIFTPTRFRPYSGNCLRL